jgi:hypothetical protein
MNLICSHCNKEFKVKENNIGQRRKSIRLGLPVYCSQTCTGLARRTNETPEEKKIHKQWYDLFIRASLTDEERAIKKMNAAILFQLDYQANPDKYKQERQRKMPGHVEYCRQPKYKRYKKEYDLNYRAEKEYGEFGEAVVVLIKLEREIDVRLAKKENGLINKSQKRKRLWQKMQAKQTTSSLLEI